MNRTALFVIPAYLLIVTVFVGYVGSKMKSYKDFALGGGTLPWYIIAGTMFAAMIGGGVMIGYVGRYYTIGMEWGWMSFGIFAGYLFLLLYAGARIKRLGLFTVGDIFRVRYGRTAKIAVSIMNLVANFAVYCAMLASFTAIMNGYVGLDRDTAMIFGLLLFIVSASLGGLKGVAYADLVQSFLIIAGVFIVGILAYQHAGGFAGLSKLDPSLLNPFTPNIPPFKMFGYVLSLMLMVTVSQSTIIQKLNACRSEAEAKKALFCVAVAVSISLIFLISLMGLSARVIYGTSITSEDQVIVKLLSGLNPIVSVIYSAAIVAAILTTANSMLISASMTFSVDLVKDHCPQIPDKKLVLLSKFFILAVASIGFILVRFVPQVIKWILITYTMQACLFVPLYGGFISKKPTSLSAVLAIVFSGVGVIFWELNKMPFGVHSVFIALGFGLVGMLIGMCAGKTATEEQQRVVDLFTQK